jgi:hypothetical protein
MKFEYNQEMHMISANHFHSLACNQVGASSTPANTGTILCNTA